MQKKVKNWSQIVEEQRTEICKLTDKYNHLLASYRAVLVQNAVQEREILDKDRFILSQQARIKQLSNPVYNSQN